MSLESRQELDWRQYQLLTSVVERGLDLLLKANTFYFAVTGAMLSFYLSRPEPARLVLRFGLLLPIVMGLAFAAVFVSHGLTVWKSHREIERLAESLGFQAWVNPASVRYWLFVSAGLFTVIAVGLAALIACPNLVGTR